MTKSQAAIIAIVRAMRDTTGNLPPLPDIFPDYKAPIVRTGSDGVRELAMARGGMPSSQFAMMEATKSRAAKLEAKGKTVDFKELLRMEPDGGTTNISLRRVYAGSGRPHVVLGVNTPTREQYRPARNNSQSEPRDQQKQQHNFAEGGVVEFSIQPKSDP